MHPPDSQKISQEEVKKLAKLCKFDLAAEEVDKFSRLLTDTLGYIAVLDELDTDDVAETYQVTGNKNVFMGQNHPITTLSKAEALANAAEQVDDLFATKAVL